MDELINKMNKIVINKNRNLLKYNRKLKYEKLINIKKDKLTYKLGTIGDTDLYTKNKILLKIDKINKILLNKREFLRLISIFYIWINI